MLFRRRRGAENKRRQFEKLARRYYQQVFAGAMRLTGDPDEASDLTQEALVRAYLGFDQFQPGTNFRAWLMKILVNTHISRYRKQQRRPKTVELETSDDGWPARELPADDLPSPEQALVEQFACEEVEAALNQLPEEFRCVVVLVDMLGLAYREVADAMGIPIGTVRSRLFRARRMLRRYLRDFARKRGLIREGEQDEA